MSKPVYQAVLQIDREDAEAEFVSGDVERICYALVCIAYHDPDWQWVQERCLDFINGPYPYAAMVAVTCLGHVARIHGELDLEKVLPILDKLRDQPEIGGRVEDAFDDMDVFMKKDFRKMTKKLGISYLR